MQKIILGGVKVHEINFKAWQNKNRKHDPQTCRGSMLAARYAMPQRPAHCAAPTPTIPVVVVTPTTAANARSCIRFSWNAAEMARLIGRSRPFISARVMPRRTGFLY